MPTNQCTNTILMVRPAHFGFNPETASNNVFQKEHSRLSQTEIRSRARGEFDNMVNVLRTSGVKVIVVEDSDLPNKPDAIFPNNWMSTHNDGSVFLYPMYSPIRREERRPEIMSKLKEEGYNVSVKDTLLHYEKSNKYLEGTGSMILDRLNKIIYACYSIRTNIDVLEEYGRLIGYEVVGFDGVDEEGVPYYHTNVIMTLGEHIAVICTESIVDKGQRDAVLASLSATNKLIIHIARDQVLQFAGNMLEVKMEEEHNLLVMSTSAYKSLKKEQLHIMNNHNKIVHCALDVIEHFGGGGARCMMAEIFLPLQEEN